LLLLPLPSYDLKRGGGVPAVVHRSRSPVSPTVLTCPLFQVLHLPAFSPTVLACRSLSSRLASSRLDSYSAFSPLFLHARLTYWRAAVAIEAAVAVAVSDTLVAPKVKREEQQQLLLLLLLLLPLVICARCAHVQGREK
jgi:hypothetical protein